MAGKAQNGQKRFIFIMFHLVRIENIKGRRKKNRKIYSKYKKYMQVKLVNSRK